LRALLLPKKKIVVGKWPWVYGVLNGLLLGAAIVLAKPYFFEGETVVSQYENEPHYGGYGYGYPQPQQYSGYGAPTHNGYEAPQSFTYEAPAGLNYGEEFKSPPPYKVVPAKPVAAYTKPSSNEYGGAHKRETIKSGNKQRGVAASAPPRVVHGPPFQARTPQHGSGNAVEAQGVKDTEVDPPLTELHYYNPTVSLLLIS